MMKTALVVGGTAATGVAIVDGLRRRGFEVTIYHRGTHELPELDDLEHIHGDPHHRDSIVSDLGSREWDVTVATYGRIRYLAEVMTPRTGQFISVSGAPVIGPSFGVPTTEDTAYEATENAPEGLGSILSRIIETEQAVLEFGKRRLCQTTVVRYPYVYGPHAVAPLEWHVIKRVLDRRRRWTIQNGGMALSPRCASPNAAEMIMRVLEHSDAAAGQIYNAADSRQFTVREWVAAIAAHMDWEFEFVDIPPAIAPLGSTSVPLAGEYSWIRKSDVESNLIRHQLISTRKACDELGYADVVKPIEWLSTTVDHWLANPPVVDGRQGRLGPAEFDYEAEDSLLSFWDRICAMSPDLGEREVRQHPYAHPKKQHQA